MTARINPQNVVARSLLAAALVGCGSPGLEPMAGDVDGAAGGTARLKLTPSAALEFGQRSPAASPKTLDVELSVEGAGTVRVVDIYLDATTSRAFSLVNEPDLPLVLEGGGRKSKVKVEFAPYAMGSYFGDLVVTMVEDGEERELTVALEGEGCADSNADGRCDG